MAIHQVSVVLDGIRDAVSGLTESIECSQATISGYHHVVLEERQNVRIWEESLPPGREKSNSAIISMPSTRTDGDGLIELTDADTGSLRASLSYPPHRISSATVHKQAGSVISLTSSSIQDDDAIADGSSSESSGSSVTPKSIDEDGDSDSVVSSDGLTNTSEEE